MAEFPALPIFTDAFIADTLHLNALQTGAYFMLLMVAWRTKTCSLPDDDDRLAAFSRLDKRTWLKNKDVIMAFWHRNNAGEFYQKRLSDERKLAEDRRNQAVQAGRASALKRKERHSTDVATELELKGNYPKPNPKPYNNLSKDKLYEPPEGVSISVWNDFVKLRKAKKAPVTETVINRMTQEADKIGWTLEQAMIETCSRGWQGFNAQWILNERKQNGKLSKSERADLAIQQALAELDEERPQLAISGPCETGL